MRIDFSEDCGPPIPASHWLRIGWQRKCRRENPNLGELAKRPEPVELTEEEERIAIWAAMLQRVADRLAAERAEQERAQRKWQKEKRGKE